MTDEPVPLESRTPVRLWFPWDMATISVLLGFPGAFGLAARNAWRLGRRGLAYLLLLAGAVILLLFFFALPDGVPQVAVIGLNLAVVGGLYAIMRAQIRAAERTDRAVERAPGLAGLATYLGGWVATAAPTFVLLVALSFLGSQAQAILAGTMTFGTAGVGCEVEGQATSLARDEPLRYVANLSRQVNAGETIHMSIRRVNRRRAPRRGSHGGRRRRLRGRDGATVEPLERTLRVRVHGGCRATRLRRGDRHRAVTRQRR